MAKKYNPYNAIKSIVGYKGDYHNEQSFGRDPSASHQAALPYYQELVDNGYESIAQQLNDLDYTGAKKLLSNYKPDNEFDLDNDYANLTGEYGSAQSIINAAHPNDASIDKLMNMGTGTTGMAQEAYNTAQGIATGTTPIQPSAATQNLLDAYGRDYERLNGAIQYDQDGNVVSGLTTSHYNTGKQQLDYYNNFDITKQPYYQGIMDAYKLGGYNAAQGEYANGAANNGGNIDSYAAANANRQQLAFTTAGMQQAMAMAQQNATNWNNLYSQMSSDLYNQGQLSLGTLQVARDMYAQDSQERMNALDVQGALASSQMENATQQVLAMIQERMNDKGITAEMAMQEKDIASQIEQLTMQLASNEKIQEGINATQRYGYDTELAGIKDTNAANLGIAGINADASRDVAGINANAQLGVAGINADASKYSAGLNYDLNKYLGDLGYKEALAGYENALSLADKNNQNALTVADLNNMSALELQKLVNEGNLAVAQAKADGGTGGTADNPSGLTDDQVMQLDVQKFVQDAWNDYKGAKKTFKTVEDIYKAVQQYDAAQYGGANTKVYRQVLDDLIKYAKANTGDTSYIQYLLGTQTE